MTNILRLLALPALLLGCLSVSAQVATAPKDYYGPPMNIKMYLSANFAEVRSDHFHSGIDIKTGGQEGEPLYSIADGYISRIGVSPTGFGRVLYITHTNGTTSVYAHMQIFTPEVEQYVNSERYRLRQHRVDLYPAEDKFPVANGEAIGLSGNSGSSLGPHLHFEIRDTPSQRTHNIVRQGFYDFRDDIPPTLVRLHYIAVDTINGVPVNANPKTYELVSSSKGVYHTADTSALRIPRSGYFVLEATDRKNDSPNNTFGIYGVDLEMDGSRIFSYRMDSFLFGNTRYVNSYTNYGMQRGSRNELLRLAVQDGNKLPIYSGTKNPGAIYLSDGSVREMKITAHDDSGNISTLRFKVAASGEQGTVTEPEGIPVDHKRAFTRSSDGLVVNIPAGALYEPVYYRQSVDEAAGAVKTAPMKPLTPVYRVHDDNVPLHSAIKVSIDVPQASGDFSKLCIARVSPNGMRYSYVGGEYSNGRVSANTRNFGLFTVVSDTKAPTVNPSFANDADLTGEESISFNVTDDFSGVASYTGEINGKWILFEKQGAVITHYFDSSDIVYTGKENKIILRVTDNRNNTNTVTRTFVR